MDMAIVIDIMSDGVNDTTFVTVKVTVDAEGKAEFNAFTLSKQCMEMVAEGGEDLGINEFGDRFRLRWQASV